MRELGIFFDSLTANQAKCIVALITQAATAQFVAVPVSVLFATIPFAMSTAARLALVAVQKMIFFAA